MQTESSTASIELDIRQHIQLFSDASIVAEQLAKKYESHVLSPLELDRLGLYFLNSGQGALFVHFCLQRRRMDLPIPWAFFASCMIHAADHLSVEIKEALYRGAKESQMESDLARCKELEFAEFEALRNARRQEFQILHRHRIQELLAQVEMLRSQDMEDEEEQTLQLLRRLSPRDEMIEGQVMALQERKAVRVLENKLQAYEPAWEKNLKVERPADEQNVLLAVLQSMREHWQTENQDEQLGHDFAVALLQWEAATEALDFLSPKSSSLAILWTRLEALLHARHFVALLSELERGEQLSGDDPDAVFALLYLKALALWGLGHRIAAIEIMEEIANLRPQYRSASTLLHLWKGGTP